MNHESGVARSPMDAPQPVQVGKAADQPAVDELIDQCRPESFDVHRLPVGVKPQVFFQLGGARRIRAPNVDTSLVADHFGLAYRAAGWEVKGLFLPGALFQLDPDDVRDDLACLLDHDRVAYPYVLAGDFVGIVQADA